MILRDVASHKKIIVIVTLLILMGVIGFASYGYFGNVNHQDKDNLTRPISFAESSPQRIQMNAPDPKSVEEEKNKLEKYLTVKVALLGVADNISLYYKDQNLKFEIAMDPMRSWVPASTIKAFVVLEAYRQRSLNLINFDQKIVIKKENVVPTELQSYDFSPLNEGVRVTIRDLINAMITQSDNTAYNTLIDILDRRNISSTLKRLGFTDTDVGEKINLDDEQYQLDLQIPGRQPNKTTIKDFALLFNLLFDKQIADSEEILSIFKRQKVNYMLPSLLPPNTVIAHKTGEFSPYYHDGGIVYKPAETFTLAIFTNSDNPSIVAQLAKAAYFKSDNEQTLQNNIENVNRGVTKRRNVVKYLAANKSTSNILGAKIKKKFIPLTAADIGITADDLAIGPNDAKKVVAARIAPGEIGYPFKRLWENWKIFSSRTPGQKVNVYLGLAYNRITEMKTVLQKGDLNNIDKLLSEFEKNLRQSMTIIKNTDVPDVEFIYVKQLNDLMFVVLGDNRKYVPSDKVNDFTDKVYRYFQTNKKEIADLVKDTGVENPFNYEPIIGIIESINGNIVTIRLTDGSRKKIDLFYTTQIRVFHQLNTETISVLKKGLRVAVVGEYTEKGEIIPIFILSDIPKDFPHKIDGIVTEINLDANTLTVHDDTGNNNTIGIDDSTIIIARDTEITLDGIKTGSQVSVNGEYDQNSRQTRAITVRITVNSSGLNERIKTVTNP